MATKDMPQINTTAIAKMISAVVTKRMPEGAVCTINSLLPAATAIATARLANMEKSM
jgi:hypothetical protein